MRAYLDHAATTALRESALEAMVEAFGRLGNPSSLHREGRMCRAVVEKSREELAAAVGVEPVEVIFVSGGTEANNLALKGLYWARRAQDVRRTTVLTLGIEHPCVLESAQWLSDHEGAHVHFLPVTGEGILEVDELEKVLATHAGSIALVNLMWANHEVGSLQPVVQAAQLAGHYGVPVHTDAVQAFGAVPVHFARSGVSTMSLSGHKVGGPGGIGALIARRDAPLTPLLHGGAQERGVRSGTVDAALVAGFGAAATAAIGGLPSESERLVTLRERLIEGVARRVPAARLTGPVQARLPGNAHFTFPGCEADSLLYLLDHAGVASSTGSACTAGVPQPSAVLLAMGMPEGQARSAQRFTLGHTSAIEEVEHLLDVLPEVFERASAAGMSADQGKELVR